MPKRPKRALIQRPIIVDDLTRFANKRYPQRPSLVRAQMIAAKIFTVFDDLEDQGYLTLPNWLSCSPCAHEAALRVINNRHRGYVFFHGEDAAALHARGDLWLGFGGRDVAAIKDAGDALVRTLRSHGLTTNWNGKITRRVCAQFGATIWN